jgi:hypothetical protein
MIQKLAFLLLYYCVLFSFVGYLCTLFDSAWPMLLLIPLRVVAVESGK